MAMMAAITSRMARPAGTLCFSSQNTGVAAMVAMNRASRNGTTICSAALRPAATMTRAASTRSVRPVLLMVASPGGG
jgi:ClpP class serine protease